MKRTTVSHRAFNEGRATDIYHSLPSLHFQNQFSEIFNDQQYERGKRGGVYVDFGANIGLTALYFAEAREYYAYEPNPEIYECLVKNTKHLNIKTFNSAVSYKDGTETMYKINDSPAQMMVPETKPIGKIEVPCKTPETIFRENNIEHCDVLKIDVEGFEYIILPSSGFEKVAQKIDFILGESHFTSSGGAPYYIPKILEEYGFTTEFMEFENLTRTLNHTEESGRKRTYTVAFPTMFYSERKPLAK